jgi:hypothetical protein
LERQGHASDIADGHLSQIKLSTFTPLRATLEGPEPGAVRWRKAMVRPVHALPLLVLLATVPTLACGALFGVDFYDEPTLDGGFPRDGGPPQDAATDVEHFCQRDHHFVCLDFDEDVLVPSGWTFEDEDGGLKLTTESWVSPPASLDSRVLMAGDGTAPTPHSHAVLLSPGFPVAGEQRVHYEVDIRILSCQPAYAYTLLLVATSVVPSNAPSSTGWQYDPANRTIYFLFNSPSDSGTPQQGGSYLDIALGTVEMGVWVHLAADVEFEHDGGSQYSISGGLVKDGGAVAPVYSSDGGGLYESTEGEFGAAIGLVSYPCEVEYDNFTLDYTVDAGVR